MIATEIKVRLTERNKVHLIAFVTVVFDDCFKLRGLRILQFTKGLALTMPARKITDLCPKCKTANCMESRFCRRCALPLSEDRAKLDHKGRPILYEELAHPTSAECRSGLEQDVFRAYHEECKRTEEEAYVYAKVPEEVLHEILSRYGE